MFLTATSVSEYQPEKAVAGNTTPEQTFRDIDDTAGKAYHSKQSSDIFGYLEAPNYLLKLNKNHMLTNLKPTLGVVD